MNRPLRSELPYKFGEIVKDGTSELHWADEAKNCQFVAVPTLLKVQLGHERIWCNKAMAVPLRQALDNVVARGLAAQLQSFDGCYCLRKQRGDLLRLSVHSWALAVDFNAATNQLGHKPTMSPELVTCFEREGFVWGGHWERPDGMHFQFVTED